MRLSESRLAAPPSPRQFPVVLQIRLPADGRVFRRQPDEELGAALIDSPKSNRSVLNRSKAPLWHRSRSLSGTLSPSMSISRRRWWPSSKLFRDGLRLRWSARAALVLWLALLFA